VTEVILREQIELERKRDDHARLDRINGVERELAVLKTRFEAALERAISGDDLKDLKREVDDHMKQTIVNIRDYFDGKTDQQSKDILGQVQLMLAHQQQAVAEEQKRTRQEMVRYGIGFALTILSALVIFWLTRNG
jgi:hypothetical protein